MHTVICCVCMVVDVSNPGAGHSREESDGQDSSMVRRLIVIVSNQSFEHSAVILAQIVSLIRHEHYLSLSHRRVLSIRLLLLQPAQILFT